MPTVYQLENIPYRAADANLVPQPGALLHTSVAGAPGTPQTTYQDSAGTVPHPNPIVADVGGLFPQIWITGSAYYLEARKSDDTSVLWQADKVTSAQGAISVSFSGPTGATNIGYTANGTGAVTRTMKQKADDFRGPKDFGATALTANDATGPMQLAITAALSDAIPGHSVFIPDGTYSVTGDGIDLTIPGTTAGRFSFFGVGNASMLLMNTNPNTNIFTISGGAGQSFSSDFRNFRVQVIPQGDNVNSYVLDTGLTSTMLDFQISGIYVNGIPRGFGGQFVSGQFTNLIFDFMPDYAIHAKSKEFRKIEIVGCHFYKVKQRSVYIQGDTDSSGNPTDIADRDNGRGAGHYTISGCGFDRHLDNSETCQHIYATQVDNATHAGNWFNGKDPGSTDYPLDAIRYLDSRYCSFSAQQAWYYGRGVYLENCDGFRFEGNIVNGNQLGQKTTGALTMINVTNSNIKASVMNSGGLGVSMDTCSDCTVELDVTDSQYTGIYLVNSSRIKLRPRVVDANLADSGTATDTYGIRVGPGCSGIEIENPHSYVTNVSAGQKVNLFIDPSLAAGAVNIYGGGRLTSVRTSGSAISDASAILSISGKVRGYVTENTVQATIAAAGTTVTVAHGLARTPLTSDFTITPAGDSHGASAPWVSAVTSTNVTLTVITAPTGSAAVYNVVGRTAR